MYDFRKAARLCGLTLDFISSTKFFISSVSGLPVFYDKKMQNENSIRIRSIVRMNYNRNVKLLKPQRIIIIMHKLI